MIKQVLNSVIAKYRDLSMSRRSIIYLSLRLRQIIDLLATDKSRYFPQPRPVIANCLLLYLNLGHHQLYSNEMFSLNWALLKSKKTNFLYCYMTVSEPECKE